jgi:hypothetical protein
MSQHPLDSFRNALIAAQCSGEPALRRLALRRFDLAWRSIAAGTEAEQSVLHERLYAMLPSDWPLWIERYRPCAARAGLSSSAA